MAMKISILKASSLLLLHLVVFGLGATGASAYDLYGYQWSSSSVSYYINSTFASSFRTAMKTSDATWDAAGADFSFSYVSTTRANPNVFVSYTDDDENSIGYYNNGPSGDMAGTWGFRSGTSLTEIDTTFNTYYSFTTTGAAGKYDVQNTMTHEFGHWLMLDDLTSDGSPSYCSSSAMSTMCGRSYPGNTYQRSLRTDDKNGIKAIYGT